MLAIVFGVQRFHTYLYGRSFDVITDHKPLVMILNKPLASASPRLQRLMIKLQGYNFTIKYRPGKENDLSDGLSRLPNNTSNETIQLDLRVDHVQFSTDKVQKLKQETMMDPVLNKLSEIIVIGWPETNKELPFGSTTILEFQRRIICNRRNYHERQKYSNPTKDAKRHS